MRREPEVPEEKVPVVECLDGLARITLEELAITYFVKNGTLQNACSVSQKKGCRVGEKGSHAHRQVDEESGKRSQKNDDNKIENYMTIWLRFSRYGAAEVHNDFAETFKHTEANPLCSIH